jgi:hypothetical protein
MLTRCISSVVYNQRPLATTSLRLLNTSASRLSDRDHTRSKAKEKAADDLKTGKEKRWLDNVASDSGKIETISVFLIHSYIYIYPHYRSGRQR